MNCTHYYKVNDCHTGDQICTECGLIVTERMLYEVDNPCSFSKTMNETHDMFSTNETHITALVFKKNCNDIVLKTNNTRAMNKKEKKKGDVLVKWMTILTETGVSFPDSVLSDVHNIITHLLCTDEYQTHSGTILRGIIAACVYRACSIHNTICTLPQLYSLFNIKSLHFFQGRRIIYAWNQKTHVCSWFFND